MHFADIVFGRTRTKAIHVQPRYQGEEGALGIPGKTKSFWILRSDSGEVGRRVTARMYSVSDNFPIDRAVASPWILHFENWQKARSSMGRMKLYWQGHLPDEDTTEVWMAAGAMSPWPDA